MGEFDLIQRYFSRHQQGQNVALSVGDDCAVLNVPVGQRIAISTDTLVQGTHFLPTISPEDLAYKAVAVNLSDLAAMGAVPMWASLALTLPNIQSSWLEGFSQSLFAILDRYQVSLIGGDTTQGHCAITLTVQGLLPENMGLFRHQAQVGEWIFVSGNLGDSAAGLQCLLENRKTLSESDRYLVQRHLRPTPRIELGLALRQFSRCAIDISDGLIGDLEHILKCSQVGAEIYLEQLPLSRQLLESVGEAQAQQFALTGGEDYELCFTVAEDKRAEMEEILRSQGIKATCIGRILPATSGLILRQNGEMVALPTHSGFDHFNR